MTNQGFKTSRILFLAATTAFAGICSAKSTNWTNASGDGLWTNPANWDNGVPAAGDSATLINPGAITLPTEGVSVGTLNTQNSTGNTLSGGTLTANSILNSSLGVLTINNPVVGTGSYFNALLGVYNGPVGGSSPALFQVSTINAANTLTAPVGLLATTITPNGSFASSSVVSIDGASTLQTSTATPNQLPDAGSIRLVAGQLQIQNTNTATVTERVGDLNVAVGQSTIIATNQLAYRLSGQTLTRSNGAMLSLSSSSPAITIATVPANSSGGSGTSRQSIPWIADLSSFNPTFYTYDAGNNVADASDDVGLRPLSSSEYAINYAFSSGSPQNVHEIFDESLASDFHALSVVNDQATTNLTGHRLTIDGGVIITAGPFEPSGIIGGGTMTFTRDANVFTIGDTEIDSTIEAPSLNKGGNGTLALARSNSLTGTITINSGTLSSRTNGALGSGTIILAGGNLRVEGESQTINAVTTAQAYAVSPTANVITGPSGVVYTGNGVTLTINNPGSGLTVSGAGTVYLPTSVQAPSISVNSSTLRVDGSVRSVSFEGSDNHLTGSGTISNIDLVLASGATYIAPGPGVAKLTLSGINTRDSVPVELQFDLNGKSAGVSYDQLVLLATSDLSSVGFDLNVGFQPQIGDAFELIDYQRTSGFLTPSVGAPEGTILTADGYQFRLSYRGGTGNDVTVTVVPEPSLTMFGVATVGLLTTRRRLNR